MNELLFVDGDKCECDFCDKKENCAHIDWMNKCVFVICKRCLERFSKEIKK
jgi:hypothetical protein